MTTDDKDALDHQSAGFAPRRPARVSKNLFVAFGVVIVVHIVAQVLGSAVSDFASLALMGVSQLVYFVPWLIWARIKKRRPYVLAISIVGGLTFVLNATCWGIVAVSFSY